MATTTDSGASAPPPAPHPLLRPLLRRRAVDTDAPRLPWLPATAVVLVLVGVIGMGELTRLTSGVLVRTKGAVQSRTPGELSDVTAIGDPERWTHWERAAQLEPDLEHWLALYLFYDVVFVAGYATLLWLLLPRGAGKLGWRRVLVLALVAVEVVEDLLQLLAVYRLQGGTPDWLVWAAGVFSLIKWVLVLAVLVTVIATLRQRGGLWTALLHAFRALRVHRLSLVVVVLLAVLSLLPLPNLFDQFPDVLRGWFAGRGGSGLHFFAGVAGYVVAAAALFVLGRLRSERSWAAHVGPRGLGPIAPVVPASYAWWLYGALVAGAVGLVLLTVVGTDAVDLRVWITFMAVPVGLVVVSVLVRLLAGKYIEYEKPGRGDPARARASWVTGDLLALSVLAIGALALVRALLVPVVLGGPAQASRGLTFWVSAVFVVALFGLAAVFLERLDTAPLHADARFRRLLRPSDVVVLDAPPSPSGAKAWFRQLLIPMSGRARGAGRPPLAQAFGLATWAVGIGFLVLVVLLPVDVGEAIGVVGTAVLALAAWSIALGYPIVHLQSERPLEVFALLRLRANPILTVLAVVALFASMFGGVDDQHALRTDPDGTVVAADRDTIAERVDDWVHEPACTTTVRVGEVDVEVRPMVLVAASGGGIRAAAWAAGVVDRLSTKSTCGSSSVLLSSGVSGGSVGLVVARGEKPGAAYDTVLGLADEGPLSVAIADLLVGDQTAGVTGLLVPSRNPDGWVWRDRAGLMETLWERDAPVLAEPYDLTVTGTPGALVLNSTSAAGCRVLISQVELEVPAAQDHPDDALCQGAVDDLPAALDLWSVYRDCLPGMSWGTAAMLSARFPTVTPAGWVPGGEDGEDGRTGTCAGLREMQLIDGGYAESSGLGTLIDIAPSVVAAVAAKNAEKTGDPVIVPIVVYLEDEPRREIAREEEDPTPELFVPVVGKGAAGEQMSSSALLQRAAAAYGHPCTGADEACVAAVAEVRNALADGVVVAAPVTEPAIEAPLGWTLSPDSRSRLEDGLDALTVDDAQKVTGYGCFKSLVNMLSEDDTETACEDRSTE